MTTPLPPPAPAYVQVVARRHTNGFAIASLVLGIVWIWWIGSILAIIFAAVALRQISETGDQGRGMAIAGLVLGIVGATTLGITILGAAAGG